MGAAIAFPIAPVVARTCREVPVDVGSGPEAVGALEVAGIPEEAIAATRMEGPSEGLGPQVVPEGGTGAGSTLRDDGRARRAVLPSVVPRSDHDRATRGRRGTWGDTHVPLKRYRLREVGIRLSLPPHKDISNSWIAHLFNPRLRETPQQTSTTKARTDDRLTLKWASR